MTVFELLGVPPPNPVVVSKLENAARRTVTLLVEAGFDQRFWWTYAHPECRVVHQGQGGRAAALARLDEARQNADAFLVAVLDADLDRVNGALVERDEVIWTDAHDLETTLLLLPTLEKLVSSLLPARELGCYESRWAEGLRPRLFRHALGMGKLRWHFLEKDEIKFKKVGKSSRKGELLYFDKYDECVEPDWTPSVSSSLGALISYNNAQRLLREQPSILAEVEALPDDPAEQICNGHDLLGFLHAWLRSVVQEAPSQAHLEQLLGVACEGPWLRTTRMWSGLRAWEAAHPGFQVLKDDVPFS